MSSTPGTVSKILWHFTGGGCQIGDDPNIRSELKSVEDAVGILNKIMEATYLKASAQPERLKVMQPRIEIREYDGQREPVGYYQKINIPLSRVVCLAEIPIQHLQFHAHRYGKVAIGFHRHAIVSNGFNPVAYLTHHSNVARSVSGIYSFVKGMAIDPLGTFNLADLPCTTEQLESARFEILNSAEHLLNELEIVMANIKSFSEREFDSIYCEREWRLTYDFHFDLDAVAMIVLPKRGGFLEKFLKDHPNIPRHIPIVSWEDLIEH